MVELVQSYAQIRSACKDKPPGLAPSHPGYAAYQELAARDKEVFIRQLLREALEKFEKRID